MDNIRQNRKFLYVLLFVVTILPLFCGYILNSGQILNWAEGVQQWNDNADVFKTNAYYVLPGLLFSVTDSMVFVYIVQILFIQAVNLIGAYLLFRTFSKNDLAVLLGVTLYVTSPYRIDLCYAQSNLLLSTVWAFVPLYLYGVMKIKDAGGIGYLFMSAVVLAVIGYGSEVMFFVLFALTFVLALVFRKKIILLVALVGGLFWGVGNVDFLRYLFTEQFSTLNIPIKNITVEGYVLSDFLTSYTYREGRPGLGIGLMLAVAVFIYMRFVQGGGKIGLERKLFGIIGVLSLWLSTKYFPWELVQRVGRWSLKLVSLIETPALFIGFAVLLLQVFVVQMVEDLETVREEMPAKGSLMIIWLAAVGLALYLCNMLTYSTPAL